MSLTTCPCCFSQFSLEDARYRCMVDTCKGKVPDPEYASKRAASLVPMGRILVGRRSLKFSEGVRCDVCRSLSTTRVCPYCHQELGQEFGQIKDQKIIAIIGGRATGKTNYIASLVTRMQKEIAARFDTSVYMIGEDTKQRWKNDFYTPLFIKKEVLGGTLSAALDSSVRAPLMFRFKFAKGSHLRVLNVSFFDAAGEDMASLSSMAVYNRYICHADGIIFLLDPLQIPWVREELLLGNHVSEANLPAEDINANPEYIIENLRTLFERELSLTPEQKVKVHIAFALSKVDALKPILEPGSSLKRPSQHLGSLDLDDVQTVNAEIDSYLTTWIHDAFMNGIRHNFASYKFFGVSSFGDQPDAQQRLRMISPLRVEDPFLWILYKLRFIDGSDGKRGR